MPSASLLRVSERGRKARRPEPHDFVTLRGEGTVPEPDQRWVNEASNDPGGLCRRARRASSSPPRRQARRAVSSRGPASIQATCRRSFQPVCGEVRTRRSPLFFSPTPAPSTAVTAPVPLPAWRRRPHRPKQSAGTGGPLWRDTRTIGVGKTLQQKGGGVCSLFFFLLAAGGVHYT